MTVGNQATAATINANLTGLATNFRDVCDQVRNFQTFITQLGTAGLEAAGYSAADAATVQQLAGYLSNVAGCYFGTVQQGGSGGTGAVLFGFDSALSAVWGGQ